MSEGNGHNVGRIVEIKGVVINAVFEGDLPGIYNALHITIPGDDGGSLLVLVGVVVMLFSCVSGGCRPCGRDAARAGRLAGGCHRVSSRV